MVPLCTRNIKMTRKIPCNFWRITHLFGSRRFFIIWFKIKQELRILGHIFCVNWNLDFKLHSNLPNQTLNFFASSCFLLHYDALVSILVLATSHIPVIGKLRSDHRFCAHLKIFLPAAMYTSKYAKIWKKNRTSVSDMCTKWLNSNKITKFQEQCIKWNPDSLAWLFALSLSGPPLYSYRYYMVSWVVALERLHCITLHLAEQYRWISKIFVESNTRKSPGSSHMSRSALNLSFAKYTYT